MGYAQHQSFHLRFNWLRKGINMLKKDPRFFHDKEAAEKIGLGKNMVQSLRFWIEATGIAETKIVLEEEKRKTVHELTAVGNIIENSDPYFDLFDTSSLIHYYLTMKREGSTVCYWYFNVYEKKTVTKEQLIKDFISWVNENEDKEISEGSLRKDIDVLIRLYFEPRNSKDPEDVFQSPLSNLGLIKEEGSSVIKQSVKWENIGMITLLYTLLVYAKDLETNNVSIEEIVHKPYLWGKVFLLTRTEIVRALEKLETHPNYPISFERTNRLNTIRLPEVDPLHFLEVEFRKQKEKLYL